MASPPHPVDPGTARFEGSRPVAFAIFAVALPGFGAPRGTASEVERVDAAMRQAFRPS